MDGLDPRWWLIWSWIWGVIAVFLMFYGSITEALLCVILFWMGQLMYFLEKRG